MENFDKKVLIFKVTFNTENFTDDELCAIANKIHDDKKFEEIFQHLLDTASENNDELLQSIKDRGIVSFIDSRGAKWNWNQDIKCWIRISKSYKNRIGYYKINEI